MVWIFFIAMSAVSALLFNPVITFLNVRAGSLSTSSSQAQKFFGSYFGRTTVSTAAFFVVLIASASLMALVAGKKAADVPTIG